MSKEETHSEGKSGRFKGRWKKWAIAFGIVVIILVGFRLFLKSDFLFDRLKLIAENQANSMLNGQLTISTLSGDLLNGVTATGTELRDQDNNRVLALDTLRVEYEFWSLLRSPHTLQDVSLSGLEVYLTQEQDSAWNVMKLVDIPPADETEESASLQWGIETLSLNDGFIHVMSDQLLPDGQLDLTQINITGSAGMREEGFYGNLRQLDLTVQETRLPEPVNLLAEGRTEDGRITLESIVINSGRSLIRAAGSFSDGDINAQSGTDNISWRDLAAYVDSYPLVQDLEIDLGVSGSLSELTISMHARAEGMETLRLALTGSLDRNLMLTAADLELENLNAPVLTGNAETPRVEGFSYNGEGQITPGEFEAAVWSGDLNINGIHYLNYRVDNTGLAHELNDGRVDASGSASVDGQILNYTLGGTGVFGSSPEWNARVNGRRINPAIWLDDPELDGDLTFSAQLFGSGFDLETLESRVQLDVEGARFRDQAFTSMNFTGRVNRNRITGNASLTLDESRASASSMIRNWQETPDYEFDIILSAVDLSEITFGGAELLPSRLNGTLTGTGRLFDPEQMTVNAEMRFDSSYVNGEEIETLQGRFAIQNSRLMVENAELESSIVDASIQLNQHLFEFTNPSNTLDFSASLKNLDPIAESFGLRELRSGGTVSGRITRNDSGVLQFDAEAELTEIAVDSLLRASEITGAATAYLKENTEAELQLNISEPVINEFPLQDISIRVSPVITAGRTTGAMEFEIMGNETNSISQQGEFSLDSTSVRVRTDQLNFATAERELSLTEPFSLYLENGTVRSDTLRIQSSDNAASFAFWIPNIDSTRQEMGLDAENLNLEALQSVIMEEPLVQGTLSGRATFSNSQDHLTLTTSGGLAEFRYNGGEMDSIRFDLHIEDEWLDGNVSAWHKQAGIFEGNLRVPYLPGDPLRFDDEFFDRKIEGRFDLNDTDLAYLLSFAGEDFESGLEDTEALINFNANLSGEAGNPQLEGNLKLTESTLSGIRIDSADVEINYRHSSEQLSLEGLAVSRQNPVLRFDALVPLIIDLQRAEVVLPSEEDQVSVNLTTENFNLAVFNDFVDRSQIREIAGRLDAGISMDGMLGNLEPKGTISLTGGAVRIVPAGIKPSQITAQMDLQPGRVELKQFSVRSGPGQIRANGTLMFENLTPGELNLTISGNQFRAANTSEYNALVDLNASLSGTFDEPNLRGDLTFLSGFVNLQNFGETAIEDVQLEEDEEETSFIDFYDPLSMEMNVSFPRDFQIRNRQFLEMEINLGGNVDLVKNRRGDLQIFGNLEAVSGYARPLGKNFILDEGTVTFTGPVDNPTLNVITRYDPPQSQDVRIFYIIEGTAQDPEFRFASEPQLELQDIISYTLFGKPFYELESWEQVVAGSGSSPSATDIALDLLLDRVETLASQRLGIDVVQIDNTGSGSSSTTSIKTGWYLNRNTFFAIVNEISSSKPKTLFMLEYQIKENLELLITQGDDSRQGIDLRWNYDY
ncbi:MAG: translocation/assembly module TamB domain-containing protein [Balneolaceae bacterium]|nr:translocation/assembly module TamB domain-containing protein [Balneolaceae bacterium]